MKKFNKVILIPARSGSKRLIHKNIKKIGGKPLIYYSIKQALKIKNIDHVIVSTDNKKYAKLAKKYGAKIFYLRPKNISTSTSNDFETFNFNEKWLNKNMNYYTDIYIHLRPTFPTRKIKDINKMLDILEKNYKKIDSIRSVCKTDIKLEKFYFKSKKNFLENKYAFKKMKHKLDFTCNQSDTILKTWYKANGNIDIFFAKNLKKKSVSGTKILPYIQDKSFDLDINDFDEFKKNINILK